jgi:hypothetical protein
MRASPVVFEVDRVLPEVVARPRLYATARGCLTDREPDHPVEQSQTASSPADVPQRKTGSASALALDASASTFQGSILNQYRRRHSTVAWGHRIWSAARVSVDRSYQDLNPSRSASYARYPQARSSSHTADLPAPDMPVPWMSGIVLLVKPS